MTGSEWIPGTHFQSSGRSERSTECLECQRATYPSLDVKPAKASLRQTLMADLSPEASKPLTGEEGRVGEEMKYAVTCEKTEGLGEDELAQPSLHGLKKWSGAKAKGVILKTTVKKSSLLITGVRGYVSFL